MLSYSAENTRKADSRTRQICGFFVPASNGRAWANTIPAREICPPSLRGFQRLAAILYGEFENIVKELIMSKLFHTTPDGIYMFNADTTIDQVYKGISARLCKAEALAAVAANMDIECYSSEIISNYLWVLSDIVRESKSLYMR